MNHLWIVAVIIVDLIVKLILRIFNLSLLVVNTSTLELVWRRIHRFWFTTPVGPVNNVIWRIYKQIGVLHVDLALAVCKFLVVVLIIILGGLIFHWLHGSPISLYYVNWVTIIEILHIHVLVLDNHKLTCSSIFILWILGRSPQLGREYVLNWSHRSIEGRCNTVEQSTAYDGLLLLCIHHDVIVNAVRIGTVYISLSILVCLSGYMIVDIVVLLYQGTLVVDWNELLVLVLCLLGSLLIEVSTLLPILISLDVNIFSNWIHILHFRAILTL